MPTNPYPIIAMPIKVNAFYYLSWLAKFSEKLLIPGKNSSTTYRGIVGFVRHPALLNEFLCLFLAQEETKGKPQANNPDCDVLGYQEFKPIDDNLTYIIFYCQNKRYEAVFDFVYEKIVSNFYPLRGAPSKFNASILEDFEKEKPQPAPMKTKMYEQIRFRADLFKQIKDEDPDHYRREDVAAEATDRVYKEIEKQLKSQHPNWDDNKIWEDTISTFKNDYGNGKDRYDDWDVKNSFRANNWQFKRSKRIR